MEKREVTEDDVQRAVNELRSAGLLSDTGPGPDGVRDTTQWLNAINEDMGLVRLHLQEAVRDDTDHERRVELFAYALKEARRLESDLYRLARDSFEVERAVIDAVPT